MNNGETVVSQTVIEKIIYGSNMMNFGTWKLVDQSCKIIERIFCYKQN